MVRILGADGEEPQVSTMPGTGRLVTDANGVQRFVPDRPNVKTLEFVPGRDATMADMVPADYSIEDLRRAAEQKYGGGPVPRPEGQFQPEGKFPHLPGSDFNPPPADQKRLAEYRAMTGNKSPLTKNSNIEWWDSDKGLLGNLLEGGNQLLDIPSNALDRLDRTLFGEYPQAPFTESYVPSQFGLVEGSETNPGGRYSPEWAASMEAIGQERYGAAMDRAREAAMRRAAQQPQLIEEQPQTLDMEWFQSMFPGAAAGGSGGGAVRRDPAPTRRPRVWARRSSSAVRGRTSLQRKPKNVKRGTIAEFDLNFASEVARV